MAASLRRLLCAGCLLTALLAQGAAPTRVSPQACTLEGMIDELRAGLKSGSPAYRRYLLAQLKEAALTLSPEALTDAFLGERDPGVLEALGGALATKASNLESAALVQPVLARAAKDGDPAARAAALRSLRATPSVESMAANGNVVTYESLARDPSPEVRQAVAENLIAESAEVYAGREKAVAETAVRVAGAVDDPRVAAELLSKVSVETVGPEAVDSLERMLGGESPLVRAAAATALGGVPGGQAQEAQRTLMARYRSESDPAVRKGILQALAQLGYGGAVPWLEQLRGVAPGMEPEIDAWVATLGLGLQEWPVILREKQRRQR